MPSLDWIGKSAVLNHHREVPYHLLRYQPRLSAGDPGNGNLLVQGDNLLALKALLPYYAGKVKCIYIDPPYNTGTEQWIYSDSVRSPEIEAWLGKVVGPEGVDLSRHDKWLCMMHPRLSLLREFLTPDGVIFISIDDNELANLRLLCDEIFGLRNRLAVFTWVRKKKGSHLDRRVRKMTEFVLAYSADPQRCVELFGEAAYADKWQPLVKRTNALKVLTFPASTVETTLEDGEYAAGRRGRGGTALAFSAPFTVQGGKVVSPLAAEGRFVWKQDTLDEERRHGTRVSLSKRFGFNVLRWNQEHKFKRPHTLLNDAQGVGTNEDASAELADIFGAEQGTVFPFPKPVSLVSYLVRSATKEDPNALVLDSFAGSGTTAHAVFAINKADGGQRRCVLVEMERKIAEEVTAERVRRIVAGYTARDSTRVDGLAGGIEFCTLARPLIDATGALSRDVKYEELARHIFFAETGEPLPATGLRQRPLLGASRGIAYFLLFNGVMGDKSAGAENVLTTGTLAALPPHPQGRGAPRVVYGEGCRLGVERLRRENVIFKQIPYGLRGI